MNSTILVFFVLLFSIQLCHSTSRVQRLMILNRSELKIVPNFEFPVHLRTLKSTLNLQLPIQFRVTNQMQLRERLRSVRSAEIDRRSSMIKSLLQQVTAIGRADFYRKLSHPTLVQGLAKLLDDESSIIDSSNKLCFQDCIKKIICQVSTVPLVHPDYGLLGELINLIFRLENGFKSSQDLKEFAPNQTHHQQCAQYFAGCPFSLFDFIHM